MVGLNIGCVCWIHQEVSIELQSSCLGLQILLEWCLHFLFEVTCLLHNGRWLTLDHTCVHFSFFFFFLAKLSMGMKRSVEMTYILIMFCAFSLCIYLHTLNLLSFCLFL